jgi:hypothetical protein
MCVYVASYLLGDVPVQANGAAIMCRDVLPPGQRARGSRWRVAAGSITRTMVA